MAIHITARYGQHDIDLEREAGYDRNWYIRVWAPSGSYAYDGWWRDSQSKTPGQALDEAIKGACIEESSEDTPDPDEDELEF